MKITHRRQKGERYALVFETKEEARLFAHYVGCKLASQNCILPKSQTCEFWNELRGIVLGETGLPT